MPRRVIFSFHHARDSWRVGQVRNCGLGRDREAVGFWDAAEWEKLKRQGDTVVRRWIDSNLTNTSVTTVLIGTQTSQRPWIRYEIVKSFERGNGLLGVYIHNVKDVGGYTDSLGVDPFSNIYFRRRADRKGVDILEWNGLQWVTYTPIPMIPSATATSLIGNASEGRLSQFVSQYDWINNDGRQNIGSWIEAAAQRVGR